MSTAIWNVVSDGSFYEHTWNPSGLQRLTQHVSEWKYIQLWWTTEQILTTKPTGKSTALLIQNECKVFEEKSFQLKISELIGTKMILKMVLAALRDFRIFLISKWKWTSCFYPLRTGRGQGRITDFQTLHRGRKEDGSARYTHQHTHTNCADD